MWQIMYEEDNPEDTTEEKIRDILSRNYMDVDIIIDAAKESPGMWFRTSGFSHFRWIKKEF